MNPDDIARILDELGQRLGPTGERVFALAVRQVYIEAILGIVLASFVIVVSVVVLAWGIRFSRRRWAADVAKAKPGGYSYESGPEAVDYVMAWLGPAALIVFALGFAFYTLSVAIPSLLNPEYAALRGILWAIAGAK